MRLKVCLDLCTVTNIGVVLSADLPTVVNLRNLLHKACIWARSRTHSLDLCQCVIEPQLLSMKQYGEYDRDRPRHASVTAMESTHQIRYIKKIRTTDQ